MAELPTEQRGDPQNAKNGFRARRFLRFRQLLVRTACDSKVVRILDLGGDAGYWRAFAPLWGDLPLEVTILNRYQGHPSPSNFAYRQGDACDLGDIGDGEFDVVHSNSVIEHVGDWARMRAFAREASRVGKHYFIQTPNFWFPIEPHFRLPLVHWLPEQVRYRLLMRRHWGFVPQAPSLSDAMREIDAMRLLDRRQMQELFPDAMIEAETLFGMPKSWMAIRG